MVTEINAAIVSPEEKLTDNVYRYSSKERVFETAADYENRDRKPSVLAALNDKKTESREKAPAPARTEPITKVIAIVRFTLMPIKLDAPKS